jgi:hypothetical protein
MDPILIALLSGIAAPILVFGARSVALRTAAAAAFRFGRRGTEEPSRMQVAASPQGGDACRWCGNSYPPGSNAAFCRQCGRPRKDGAWGSRAEGRAG